MTLTMHVGVRKEELPTFVRQIKRMLPDGIDPATNGDLWDAWDQNLPEHEQGKFDEGTHVIIETLAPLNTINLLASRFSTFLVERFDGALIVVTDTDDWDLEYLEMRYPATV